MTLIEKLPDDVAEAVGPLFEKAPMEEAMTALVVTSARATELSSLVSQIVKAPAIAAAPTLAAGLWLYVDELDRSHLVSQGIHDATGSYWHGIMHRREGDFSNSHYWFRQTGAHPAMREVGGGYDGHALIDEVAAAHRAGDAPAHLIARQQDEWATLFAWCANRD